MLRANVGLSRKFSRDYQSTGYTVNIDGEIAFLPDDAEGVLTKSHSADRLARHAQHPRHSLPGHRLARSTPHKCLPRRVLSGSGIHSMDNEVADRGVADRSELRTPRTMSAGGLVPPGMGFLRKLRSFTRPSAAERSN